MEGGKLLGRRQGMWENVGGEGASNQEAGSKKLGTVDRDRDPVFLLKVRRYFHSMLFAWKETPKHSVTYLQA